MNWWFADITEFIEIVSLPHYRNYKCIHCSTYCLPAGKLILRVLSSVTSIYLGIRFLNRFSTTNFSYISITGFKLGTELKYNNTLNYNNFKLYRLIAIQYQMATRWNTITNIVLRLVYFMFIFLIRNLSSFLISPVVMLWFY